MNTFDVLRYGHGTVLGTLDGVPESLLDRSGACGVWSVKDIIAHLASYEVVLVDILTSIGEEVSTPNLDRLRELGLEFNGKEVDARRDRSMVDVLAELNGAHERTLDLVRQLAPETIRQPGTLPWYGAEYSLDDLIVYQYYGHKREHAAQIEIFRDHSADRERVSAASRG